MNQTNETTKRTRVRSIVSDFGRFVVSQRNDGTLQSGWMTDAEWAAVSAAEDRAMRPTLFEALDAYFGGECVDFDEVETPSGPPFFRRCWEACRRIDPGTVWSYQRLACAAGGSPGAARAAGQAMRRNPLPIIVPCHRVIGADGHLHGFSGSTDPDGDPLTLKTALLDHEQAYRPVA